MENSKYDSNASRREFLKLIGIGAVGVSMLGLSSCFTSSSDIEKIKFIASGTLNIDNWDKLLQELDLKISFTDSGNDVGPIIGSMIHGTAAIDYDVAGNQGGTEHELAMAGKILPWDLKKIPNWDKTWSWIKEIESCRVDDKQYGLPIVANADSIIYNHDRIGFEVESYGVIFDPKFKGRTAMEDSWMNSVIFTAMYLKGNGFYEIDKPGDLTEDELGFVMEFLIKHKVDGQFKTFWSGWEDGVRLIKSEEVWAMTGWEPIVYAGKEDGLDIRYAVPKEGYEGWTNNLLLLKGAEERGAYEVAHKFANWLMNGYYGCVMADSRGYLVPNDTTLEFAKDSPNFDLVDQTNKVEHVKNKFANGKVYWQNVRPTNYKLYEEWWSKLRNA